MKWNTSAKGSAQSLGTEVEPGRLGQFLQAWTDIENALLSAARVRREKVFSLREALAVLRAAEALPEEFLAAMDDMRRLRNSVVHEPRRVAPQELTAARTKIAELQKQLAEREI